MLCLGLQVIEMMGSRVANGGRTASHYLAPLKVVIYSANFEILVS